MSNLRAFLETELQKRKALYSEDPLHIVRDYRIEKDNIESYNGRQLLEMLQNVDDASETAKVKKALIKLSSNKLIIANNGEPFNEDGFVSILNSHISTKTKKQNKIGQKGLGFRSILSWADEVTVDSADATVRFSEKIAQSFLASLMATDDNGKIAKVVQKFGESTNPIAVLSVPKLVDGYQSPIIGYDTVIEIKLRQRAILDVRSQLSYLITKETLLFLNNLDVLEIDSPTLKTIFKKRVHHDGSITVESTDLLTGDKQHKRWDVSRSRGEHKGKNYELAVAWNSGLDDKENVLYSYFKTKVGFPFRGLVHGTFELSSDRNQLVNDTEGHNRFLITKLAELLVKTALQIASTNADSNYLPLKFLQIDFDNINSLFREFHFKETIIGKIKSAKVFPTANGGFRSFSPEPVYYSFPIADFVSGADVRNLLKHCKDKSTETFLIDCFAPFRYTTTKFSSIINRRLKKLSISELASLIFHFFTSPLYEKDLSSDDFSLNELEPFLPDNSCNPITWDSAIFLPTDYAMGFKLPESIQLSFVNSDLVTQLLSEWETDDIDDITEHLAKVSVKPFSFMEVASTIIEHYSKKPFLKIIDVKEMHGYLFHLFEGEKTNHSKLPNDQLETPILCLNKRIGLARDVYLGEQYQDNLMSDLYSFDKSKLLAGKELFGLEGANNENLTRYFRWLGVETLPRLTLRPLRRSTQEYDEYSEHVFRNIDYKKPIDSEYPRDVFRNYNHLKSDLYGVRAISVGYFDDLKKILSRAKREAIFKWISRDERLRKTLEEDKEILPGSVILTQFRAKQYLRHTRHGSIPSYTRWLFSTIPWLPVESSTRKAEPDRCCLSKTITEEFSPFVEKPKIDIPVLSDKLGLPEGVIETYIVNVGVHREIKDFSTARLYGMLRALPNADRKGTSAKSIYREVITNFEENRLDAEHPAYLEFLERGLIFCHKGHDGNYFPVSDSYYIDTKSFGNNILRNFPLAAIDKKKGAQKVKRLFGIKQLQNISFTLTEQPLLHPLDSQFNEEIKRFKGLIYALRMREDEKHVVRNRLKQLRIFLCEEVHSEFTHEGESEPFELEKFEFISLNDNKSFYVLTPSHLGTINELRQSVPFCDSLAEIFTTVINSEQHREFIHDLYSNNEGRREIRLRSYLHQDNNSEILEAKKQLDIIDEARLSFWRSFVGASEKHFRAKINNENDITSFFTRKLKLSPSDIKLLLDPDTYSDLAEFGIQSVLYDLFVRFSVDFAAFTRHFSDLDFTNLFRNKYEDVKSAYRREFKEALFKKLENEALSDRLKYFNSLDVYDDLEYLVEDGFVANINEFFLTTIITRFSVALRGKATEFSTDSLIKQNSLRFRDEGFSLPFHLLERNDVQALLLFEETEELAKILKDVNAGENTNNPTGKRKAKRIKFRGEDIDFDDFESLASTVLEGLDFSKLKLRSGRTSPFERSNLDKRKGGVSGKKRSFDSSTEETIGFISELFAYHILCEKKGEANVQWVSENAFRAKINLSGEAGKGYDFRLEEEDTFRYVEVKGIVSAEEGFKITENEYKKAMAFPEKYDLLFIENPLGNSPTFRYWKQPFKFKRGETFLSNNRFSVLNDGFLIRFSWL